MFDVGDIGDAPDQDDKNNGYDIGVIDAVYNFVRYGFYPGSCAMYLILGDMDRAYKSCHHHARKVLNNTAGVCRGLVPRHVLNDHKEFDIWVGHRGLAGGGDAETVAYLLSHGDLIRSYHMELP